jgi:hypothetical protein
MVDDHSIGHRLFAAFAGTICKLRRRYGQDMRSRPLKSQIAAIVIVGSYT